MWPNAIEIPERWRVVFGAASRADCVEYVEANWLDMRPKSLRDVMAG
ncbi:Putative MbtH family protein [Mycobacteroides abscessus subsp. abscessus]|nr:Putative MbtH family protein [Mycobacteroides abscessus subsp. abscessus]